MPPKKRRAVASPPSDTVGGTVVPISSTAEYIPSLANPFVCVVRGCTSQFGADGDAVPHRLSCGDAVCAGCWSASQAVGSCPVCGMAGASLEFVDEAMAIAGRTRIAACSIPASPPVCSDCKVTDGSDTPATHICGCTSVGKPLCCLHVPVHVSKRHDPVPLDALAAALGDVACPKHPDKNIELYCATDRERLCSGCVLYHKGRGHEVVPIGDAPTYLAPELTAALSTLETQCATVTASIHAVQDARASMLTMASTSEGYACAAFEEVHVALEALKADGVKTLHDIRDQRDKKLDNQCAVLERGLGQMRDGVALGKLAIEKNNPGLLVSTLKTLSVLSRIPAREFTGPCESGLLSLDVDTSALLEALPHCTALRQVCVINAT